MKVAYFAESPADGVAIRILTEAILGTLTKPTDHKGLEARGWPSVRTVLPAVLKELHYHSDAEGFVLVVDSNGAPPHLPGHDEPESQEPKCRLCQLKRIANEVMQQVRPMANRPRLKVSFGLAVPAIEAWLLCDQNAQVTEAAWINGLKAKGGQMPYTKGQLKQQLYGTTYPSLQIETEAMKAAASLLAQNLAFLEKAFPYGFGALLKDCQGW